MLVESIVTVDSLSSAARLFGARGIEIAYMFPFISAVAVRTDLRGVKTLRDFACVKSVHGNCTARVLETKAPQILSAPELHRSSAKKVGVAVIDTGVSEHLDLVLPENSIAKFVDFVAGGETPYDDNGHGTAVAGIICGNGLCKGGFAGNCSPARIIALKALNAVGEGSAFDILRAMQWIVNNKDVCGIKVVNLSFGTPCESKTDPLRLGAEALVKNGLTVVVSAGNGNAEGEGVLSPGISPYVITVGGADGNRVADFSARGGGKPDIVAQAVAVPTISRDGGYINVSGTSMAAPKVSAAVAKILAKYPSYSPDRVKSLLRDCALKIDGDNGSAGGGILDDSHIDRL